MSELVVAVHKIIAAPWWKKLFPGELKDVKLNEKFVPDIEQVHFAKMELEHTKKLVTQLFTSLAKSDLVWFSAPRDSKRFYKQLGFIARPVMDYPEFANLRQQVNKSISGLDPALQKLLIVDLDYHPSKSLIQVGVKDPNSHFYVRDPEVRLAWESISKNDIGRKL